MQLWVPPELRAAYREVAERDQRTVAGAIRHHMQTAVAEAEAREGVAA